MLSLLSHNDFPFLFVLSVNLKVIFKIEVSYQFAQNSQNSLINKAHSTSMGSGLLTKFKIYVGFTNRMILMKRNYSNRSSLAQTQTASSLSKFVR